MDGISFLIFQLAVLIFSVMIHEVSHGYVAERLGDPTARLAGRLTMNPLRHLDPVGSIFLPLLLFLTNSPIILGWAKPVPYNPLNLSKDYKYGPLRVALAGPISNLIVLLLFGLGARIIFPFADPVLVGLFGFIAYMNAVLAIFNLLPIPPLDGSKIFTLFLPSRYAFSLERMGMGGLLFIFLFVYLFSGFISIVSSFIFGIVAGPEVAGSFLELVSSLLR